MVTRVHFCLLQVVVDIKDKDAQDLTIIDLPGLVRSMDKPEQQVYVEVVENMTRDFIK